MRESLLIMLHCEEETGYAIASLEEVFFRSGALAGFSDEEIVWSFNGLKDRGNPRKIDCDYRRPNSQELHLFLRQHKVSTVLAFDLGCPSPVLEVLRRSGVRRIISYWGAGMSGINTGLKLALKRLEYRVRRYRPDLFIFESEAMRSTATHGRGVPIDETRVIRLGVDVERFSPNYGADFYAHDQLRIPRDRKIVFYSGHMEERKGVWVIMDAAVRMSESGKLDGTHFLICGNKGNEAAPLQRRLEGSSAGSHVTFAGYRNDVPQLMRSSAVGVIASTGWDSFTMSSVEMMASGLPMLVSKLGGLSEAVEHGVNGYLIQPGNAVELAERIWQILGNEALAKSLSMSSRLKAEREFRKDLQIAAIAGSLRH